MNLMRQQPETTILVKLGYRLQARGLAVTCVTAQIRQKCFLEFRRSALQ